jgi:hypothetical protein
MSEIKCKEDVFQRELYQLIFYLQGNDYSSTTRRDMLEDVLTNLCTDHCLDRQTHLRGVKNLLAKYRSSEQKKMIRDSLESIPTNIDEVIGSVNLVFWIK